MSYLVQVGRGTSKYKTKYSFDSPAIAYLWYRGINIDNGYKKRLINGETGEVIERSIS